MFRKAGERQPSVEAVDERVDSVLGSGISWQGEISGTGGIRIDGAFDGEIGLRGLVVIGEQGRGTCPHIRAATAGGGGGGGRGETGEPQGPGCSNCSSQEPRYISPCSSEHSKVASPVVSSSAALSC